MVRINKDKVMKEASHKNVLHNVGGEMETKEERLMMDNIYSKLDDDVCTCGMCPKLPPNQIITGAYHNTNPDKIIPVKELCEWHNQHGNEGLYYLIAEVGRPEHNKIMTGNDGETCLKV